MSNCVAKDSQFSDASLIKGRIIFIYLSQQIIQVYIVRVTSFHSNPTAVSNAIQILFLFFLNLVATALNSCENSELGSDSSR